MRFRRRSAVWFPRPFYRCVLGLAALLLLAACPAQPLGQAALSSSTLPLMPLPWSVQPTAGRMPVDSNFFVAIQGVPSKRLRSAVKRAIQRISQRSGATLRLCHDKFCQGNLLISADTVGQGIQSISEDESYSLDIDSNRARLLTSIPKLGRSVGWRRWFNFSTPRLTASSCRQCTSTTVPASLGAAC